MEHTEYLVEKKKKQKGRKLLGIILLFAMAVIGAGIFFYHKEKAEEEQTNPNAREAIVLQENQSWLCLRIENIIGNEIEAVEVQMRNKAKEEMKEQDTPDEKKTYQIPVGTEVVTKHGSITTFSRLASGDTIYCLTQQSEGKAEILKIWIEE